MCFTGNDKWQVWPSGWSSSLKRYEWVIKVWPFLQRVKSVTSLRLLVLMFFWRSIGLSKGVKSQVTCHLYLHNFKRLFDGLVLVINWLVLSASSFLGVQVFTLWMYFILRAGVQVSSTEIKNLVYLIRNCWKIYLN